jgi:KUP system potassium uptake protein
MLTWRSGWQLLEQERSKLRQREDEFVDWVVDTLPIRLPGAAAIFTAATTGIPLGLTHHLRHNRVLHERVLFIASIIVVSPRVDAAERVKLVPVGAGITRVLFYFGFMETPDVMEGLRLACQRPELQGIDPEKMRRPRAWRSGESPCSPLNANPPAAYFGVPATQVVEVGLEVEIASLDAP